MNPSNVQSNEPSVYIILVNWNRFDDTAECISSLNQLTFSKFSIIVVDNGSVDHSVSKLKQQFPQINLIQSETNLGFAVGCNLGIREAIKQGAEFLWLLNNDTVVDPQALYEMIKVARDPAVGITGSKIFYFERPDKVWAMGAVFNVNTGDARHIQVEHDSPRHSSEKLYIPGCSMLISRSCLEATGYLDESYFHLGEDVDYCLRADQKGFKLEVARNSRVWHKVSSSMTGFSPRYNYYEQRNRLLLVKKYHFAKKPLLYFFHFTKRIAIALLMGMREPIKNARYIFQGLMDYSKGISGQRVSD